VEEEKESRKVCGEEEKERRKVCGYMCKEEVPSRLG
jgi:hypothetical protein